jgi:hypothetical protein
MSLPNGSLSKGPAATSSEQPDAGGERSTYAPKWARDMYGTSQGPARDSSVGSAQGPSHGSSHGSSPGTVRKIVRLRTTTAPQLAPHDAPATVYPPGRRPTGPELLAEDEVLKRLLQRHAPDPQPLVAKPTRDPVGLALGMVARLIVAGCAAGVVALLLVGVIPLPVRLGPSNVASQTVAQLTPPAPAAMTLAAAQPTAAPRPATPVATVSVRVGDAAPVAAPGAAAIAAAARAPAAAAPAPADSSELDAGDVDRLVKRGEDYLAQGDIAAARLVLARAAATHDPRAALSLGATYDPAVLGDLHVVGFRPDIAQARAWYEKAAGYGSHDAAARLAALPSRNP